MLDSIDYIHDPKIVQNILIPFGRYEVLRVATLPVLEKGKRTDQFFEIYDHKWDAEREIKCPTHYNELLAWAILIEKEESFAYGQQDMRKQIKKLLNIK